MVLHDPTTDLQQDASALVPSSKDTDMGTDPTQHSEETSDGDESANDNYDDDDDDERDDDDSDTDSAASGERAFGAFKSSATANANNSGRSIRRSNSWTSFLTRSERHHEEVEETPRSPTEVAAHKVRFRDEPELEEVWIQELDPPLTPAEKKSCHLSNDDNERMEMEVQMTFMRWDNHKGGKIAFDDNRHSIRGLIEHVDEQCPERNRDGDIHHHMTRVLQEQLRQLTSGSKTLDQERVGQIARESGLKESKRAQYIAQKDRISAEEAWKEMPPKKLINHAHGKKGASTVEKKKRWGEVDKKDKHPGDNSSKPKRHSSPAERKKTGVGKLLFWK
jgi:hypothetical protein